eukprot:4668266-Prymnesium_polylepis.2
MPRGRTETPSVHRTLSSPRVCAWWRFHLPPVPVCHAKTISPFGRAARTHVNTFPTPSPRSQLTSPGPVPVTSCVTGPGRGTVGWLRDR